MSCIVKYRLIDEDNLCTHEFRISKSDEYYIEGSLYSIVGTKLDNEPCDYEFVTDAYIKWDACSHFWFYGEDYDDGEELEKDSYYHICGGYNYLDFIRGIAFIYKLARENIKKCDKNEFENKDILRLIENCKIVKLES